MKIVSKIWEAFNGKKTIIGIAMHAAWFAANIAFKDLSTQDEAITGHALIFTVTGVGIGHKISKKVNQAIEKANSDISINNFKN